LQGDLKTSISALEQSLAIREGLDSDAIISIYVNLGWIAADEVDYDAARKYFEQAMNVAQAAESNYGVAFTFANLGILAFLRRDHAGAEAALEQGLNAGRASGIREQCPYYRAVWPTWRCSGGKWSAQQPYAGSRC
jgi:tetratricopeptide (TPR) repeat protein